MADKLATNHERIWLQPLCCIDERCWCEHPQDCGDDGCDLPPIEYIRADMVGQALDNARQMNRDLLAALKLVISDIEAYEHVNNLAPNPGRTHCWDSVAQAHAVIAKAMRP